MAATKKAKPKKSPKKRASRPPRPKQGYLPTMEPDSFPEIDRLADSYRDIRDERMEMTKEEVKAADKLEIAMKSHGLQTYEYDGQIVRLQQTEKVKVEKKKPAEFVRETVAKREAGEE